MIEPVAIAVAPNGGRKVKADHPAVPLSPAELAHTAATCLDQGASMIHVHVRKPDGTHLLDADAYRLAIDAIRGEVGDRMVVQITTEAVGIYKAAAQRDIVRAVRPEAASLALRELVPDASEERAFSDLLLWMKQSNVVPQIILYDVSDLVRMEDMRKRGVIPFERIPLLFVLGRYTIGQKSVPGDLLPYLASGIPQDHWSICAFGAQEIACVTTAALLGGHIRVGFENNELLPDGSRAADNAALVTATRHALVTIGRRTANAEELRASTRV